MTEASGSRLGEALSSAAVAVAMMFAVLAGCADDGASVSIVAPAEDGGCPIELSARSYEIYFVLDVPSR